MQVVLLTTSQVADRFGVSVQTVLRMVKRGDLVAIRLSAKNYRFDADDIDAFLATRGDQREAS